MTTTPVSAFSDRFDRAVFREGRFVPEASDLREWLHDDSGLVRLPGDRPLAIQGLSAAAGALRLHVPAGLKASVLVDGVPHVGISLRLDASANLQWLQWQQGSADLNQEFEMAEGSELNWFGLQSAGPVLKMKCTAHLNGAGASSRFHGLSFAQKEEQTEQHIDVLHHQPATVSAQLFKSVLRERAKNVFAGRIVIDQDAQKSDARQRHQSLNLDSTAQSITRPELEVAADDVKAAHGATVGRLDQEQLFYLRARGVSLARAREMLARAFVDEILAQISDRDLWAWVDTKVGRQLTEFLASMEARP